MAIREARACLQQDRGGPYGAVRAFQPHDLVLDAHGSLYSQFGSKERLVEEAVADAIAAKGKELRERSTVGDYVSEYLSPAHRDQPGSGCPFAALCCEIPRQSRDLRERF